jgi:protein BUR2
VRELVIACCRVAQKNPNLIVDENTKDYWRWRDTILHNEDVLLELLCFDLTIESPYNVLFGLLQYYGVEKQKRLRDAAWSFINDSHMTQACLLFTSRIVACASLWFAAKQTGAQFSDDDSGRPWWEVKGVATKDLRRALAYMGDFYTNTPTGLQVKGGGAESVYAALKSSPLEVDEDATRLRKSVTPQLMTPVRAERSGSEVSINGKRRRDEDDEAKVNGGMNGNGSLVVPPTTNGTGSRIPAAARDMANGEHPAKRQRTAEAETVPEIPQHSADAAPAPAPAINDEDAGSEEGEVEE